MKHTLRTIVFGLLLGFPVAAAAQRGLTIKGMTGTIMDVIGKLVTFFGDIAPFVAVTVFLIGALWKVLFAGKEDQAKRGNTMMTGALWGLGIILLSYAIVRLVFYILYGN